MKIESKIVVVSGASSGIGAAASELLAREGAHVVMLARTESKLREVGKRIEAAGGKADYIAVDLADPDAAMAAGQQLIEEFGVPDVLVNNAGAGRWLAVDETDPAEAVEMMGAPYFAAFFLTRAVLPAMLARNSGLIVNLNSPASRVTWPGATGYVAARWALRGFNEGLAGDLRGTGVRVSEYIPGEVTSDYWSNNPGTKERIPRIARMFPSLTPEQAAKGLSRAIRSERRLVVRPWSLLVMVWLNSLMPRLVRALMNGTGWKRGG